MATLETSVSRSSKSMADYITSSSNPTWSFADLVEMLAPSVSTSILNYAITYFVQSVSTRRHAKPFN